MPAIRQILLLGHTHHDVGYTNSPRLIDDLHARLVPEVMRLAEQHAEPGPDRFRWTFEVARPVLRFLRTADADEVARLRALVADGRISVTGGYLNMTQLPSEAEFDAAYDALERIRDVGIPVRTQQHGDVNGIAWGTVEQMRRAGLDRLVMALNPDHGRPPLAQPSAFWWEGQSGDRVLVWLSTHYGYGEEWGIVDGDVDLAEREIAAFVQRLEARDDYPFDTAIVHAGNDNRWPTALFLEVVRAWNARHPDIPMRTTTIDEALDAITAHDADLPVLRGEWSDWWSHGHGSTAREVAVYRQARAFARAGQSALGLALLRGDGDPALATVMGYRRGPVRLRSESEILADLERVDESLLLYGEHTWGSWETYSKPFSVFSHAHHNAKSGFAYTAYDLARDLAIEGMFRLAGTGDRRTPPEGAVLVVNPTELERTEPVSIEIDGTRRGRVIATVPAFGAVTVPLPPAPSEPRAAREVETPRYRVRVDPARGGVVSLIHRSTGRELVDASAGHGLGAIVVETIAAGSEHPYPERPKDFHPDFPGPRFDRSAASGTADPTVSTSAGVTEITWRMTPPGLPESTATVVLYDELDAIDLEVALVKPEAFGPESIHVAFPFLVDAPEFLLETAGAVYAAGREQLPDTSSDWYSIQHAIGVNGAGDGIVWGSFDAPLVQLGGFHTGQWARSFSPEHGHINSWLMNNLHFTNFQARQEGTHRYRYRFAPTDAPVDHARVRRAGRDLLEPLQARHYRGPVLEGSTGLTVDPADALLAEVRPLGDGAVRVRLRNITAESVETTVAAPGQPSQRVAVPGFGRADAVLRAAGA